MRCNGVSEFWFEPKFLVDIVSKIPGCVYWKDKNGVFIGCNDNFVAILGYQSAAEIIGKTDDELGWDEKLLAKIIREDKKVISQKTTTVSEDAYIVDGKLHYYQTEKRPIYYNDEVVGVLCISIDITTKKNAEKIREAFFIDIFAKMPGLVYWKNIDGTYLGCNNNLARLMGFDRPIDVIGKTDCDINWGNGIGRKFFKEDQMIIKTGQIKAKIYDKVLTKEGCLLQIRGSAPNLNK